RLGFLAAGALLGPAMVTIRLAQGAPMSAGVAVTTGLLVALVLLRVAILNRDLDEARSEAVALAGDLSATNEQLRQARRDQRRLNERLHRAVEDERTRIAADLHDRPLQQLTGVGYQLERMHLLLERGDIAKATDVCSSAANMLSIQLGEIRSLMTEIRPPVLDERGLLGALEDRGHALQEAVPELTVRVVGEDHRFDSEVETILDRVAQEALSNVVRHAQVTEAVVTLSENGHDASLLVMDNGRGLDGTSLTELLREGHFGLAGMTERVELIGGRLDIDHTVERGAALRFTVPRSLQPNELKAPDTGDLPLDDLESVQ
ncbi:MAG: sensor histidine kinase, partial [Actinomycetota bacterium]|nr:sensor histidine kinase [Actinomycetota bacterium]